MRAVAEKKGVSLDSYCSLVDTCLKDAKVSFIVHDGWLNLNIYGRDEFVKMVQQKARDGVKTIFLTQKYVVERKGKPASETLPSLIGERHHDIQLFGNLYFFCYTRRPKKLHCIIADNKVAIVESLHHETDDNRCFRPYNSSDIASALHYYVMEQLASRDTGPSYSDDYTIIDDLSYKILKWCNGKFKQKELQYAEKNPFKWIDDVVSDMLSAIEPAKLKFYKEYRDSQIKLGPRKFHDDEGMVTGPSCELACSE
ncbi:MAG: hypothetical protein Q7J54_05585 [Candidatus Woesearchaeota archaeon]|nr:hypothetical protein [Candidatus Woesearchaeota archaeon]